MPDLNLPNATGNRLSLADFRGQNGVLYFYSRDNALGGIQEACSFLDACSDDQVWGVMVLGIKMDGAKPRAQFAQKFNSLFPRPDAAGQVATTDDHDGLKKFMGVRIPGYQVQDVCS